MPSGSVPDMNDFKVVAISSWTKESPGQDQPKLVVSRIVPEKTPARFGDHEVKDRVIGGRDGSTEVGLMSGLSVSFQEVLGLIEQLFVEVQGRSSLRT